MAYNSIPRMQDFMVDKKGFTFSLYGVLCVGVVWALASFWYPIHKHVMESETPLYASVGVTQAVQESGSTSDVLAMNTGKRLHINLGTKELELFDDTTRVDSFVLHYVPDANSPDRTPAGSYTVDKKTSMESSTITMVRFPFFVRFGDRYVLHGTPTDSEGDVIEDMFVGSKIELDTESAEKVFNFVEVGTPVFVSAPTLPLPSTGKEEVHFSRNDLPATSALAYAVSDVETGEVLLVKGGDERYPIASITKLVTAAVATDVVGHGAYVTAPDGEAYTLSDLYYPLLLKSDNRVAERISAHVGTGYFMNNMNAYVRSLGMQGSSFADTSGLSPKNLSTANDLVRFAHHLYREKSFLYDISKSDDMAITSGSGKLWNVKNQNSLAQDPYFRGGKLGFTDEAGQTSLAVFDVPLKGKTRSVAVIVLRSKDWKQDTRTLLRWLVNSAS